MFSTHFGSTKQNMKYRLRNLFDMAAKRRGIAALCAIIACTLTLTSFVTVGHAAAKPDSVQSAQEPISDLMIHARANDGTWAAASSIEGKTWQKQIDEEIKWLEDAYKGYNTRFVITETMPKSEMNDIARIGYLYENSGTFRSMSQMKNGAFTVEDSQSFSEFGAAYNPNMMQRTAVMVDNDKRLTIDINYTLTQGKLAVWLIDPDGKTIYQSDFQKTYQSAHTVSGKKGLWSVITINEGNGNGSMEGNISIVLRQTEQPQAASSNLSIQRLGRHTIQNVDTLKINLKWNGKGNVMLLYTDQDYTDDEILVPLQGISGLPKPNYDNVNPEKVSGVFNFSASPTSPLLQQNRVAKSGPYYFYIVQYGFDTLNKLTGEVSRIDAEGDIYGIWGLHSEAVDSVQAKPPISPEDKPAFQIKSNGAKSVTKSGSFEAKAGQKLILVADSNIKGGSVDFFLFSPSGKEQRFTIGGSATIKTIELSAGTWAYNCTGFFESGNVEIIGKITNGAQAKSTAADKAAYEVMQYSRSWVIVEYMLPYMTKDGIAAVVKLNNELNPSSKKTDSDYYSLATPSKTESDQRSYTLMEKSGNWTYSSPLFPYMTNDGIDKVVTLYNQKTGKNVKATDYYN